ncbi:crossover junction endodeoxyribonuclease RuvC [Estrella lausannensis]|uniref:Crossover junction endodeoxyribonuclease RuvC n=1 Tax=Estrella lausannensis TaxID=483423 RepID=A0A0H5DSL8_9BACT|nr:crossover junction endodeoxyribonuclease RuvC [Estrella lausannensis]CRX38784.1 Crossover junction endodeoxyribonuclease RuvC [Estrella lausannensis]
MNREKKSTVILGIDPGTQVTGYGVIHLTERGMEAVDFGCIRPKASLSLHDKYLLIFNGVSHLLDTFQPIALAIETQFVKINPSSALKLGMARGSIIVAARMRGIEVVEYAPTVAKKSITGTGRASKEQVQGMTQKILKLDKLPTPEDAADALSIAICHANRMHFKSTVVSHLL